VALRVLLDHGAALIARNVVVGRGEIDLHVRFARTVVAVEVKALAVDDPDGAEPLRSYTDEKAAQVHRLARKLEPRAHRVDVMGVVVHRGGVEVRWVRAA